MNRNQAEIAKWLGEYGPGLPAPISRVECAGNNRMICGNSSVLSWPPVGA